mgnify:CR=1 FL=1
MYSDNWSKSFLIDKLQNFNSAKEINSKEQNLIEVKRKKGLHFNAFVLSLEIIQQKDLEEICGTYKNINFIVNIKKQYYILWDSMRYLHNKGISFGSVGDFMRFCNEEDNSILTDKEFSFVERGLRQHSKIKTIHRLDNRKIEIVRNGLKSVVAIMINEYDITAESIRFARDLYGDFKVVIKTNPNGSITSQAEKVGEQLNIEICKWGEFLGKLNSKWND